ncbi:MAG TPA: radical SAM protein [Gemmataceae bacterium]|jgi:oxygen-independent coproporphyrinogen-3 oxidase
MISLPTIPSRPTALLPTHEDDALILRERMDKPQRHRLLHGYPLAAAMHTRDMSRSARDVAFNPRAGRGLLVGVLPHPFCNPAVAGCGFCTFPHQAYNSSAAASVVEHVLREIDQLLRRQPALYRRKVTGLYFGGGTANLTPTEPFRRLCRRLAATFDLSQAEITLEGVPAYFVKRQPLLVDILREEIPARHFRLSMGIQTFDEGQLRRMGRLAFGTADTFRQVVELAHERGFTVSADLLCNLPGQTLDAMRHDLAQAAAIGLDHLGLYHLVLFRGLGTAWSRDADLLAALPDNEEAARNWLHLRDDLLSRDFVQTTLTNFERAHFRADARRFLYEECSFHSDRFDMIGFGSSAISFSANRSFRSGFKVINPDNAAAYEVAVAAGGPVWDRWFWYTQRDLRVFHLTRRLAALSIDRREYRRLFGADAVNDFPREFDALSDEGLIEIASGTIRPTPRGMFYADSIAALLAWRQVRALRRQNLLVAAARAEQDEANDNALGHM